MIISGHQPVYLPWLGLFHKMMLCDIFVYMDTVQYLDGDWNNRNKIRTANSELLLSIPIDKKNSNGKNLNEIKIFNQNTEHKDFWQRKHWESIKLNYKKSHFFEHFKKDLEKMYLDIKWENLVDVCWHQFNFFKKCFGINCRIVRMSEMKFEGKKDDLILNHCLKLNGNAVVFGEKGKDYVDTNKFDKHNIKIYFQKYNHPEYKQRFIGFFRNLSVIDLLLNHGPDESKKILMSNNITKDDLVKSNKWYKKN